MGINPEESLLTISNMAVPYDLVLASFKQEKALVGAFSVIVKTLWTIVCSCGV